MIEIDLWCRTKYLKTNINLCFLKKWHPPTLEDTNCKQGICVKIKHTYNFG